MDRESDAKVVDEDLNDDGVQWNGTLDADTTSTIDVTTSYEYVRIMSRAAITEPVTVLNTSTTSDSIAARSKSQIATRSKSQ